LNFGKVSYSGRYWYVKCEPHVSARLKRVFPRVPQVAAESLMISATPENSRELQWFLQRYPMEIDTAVAMKMEELANEHVEMEVNLNALLVAHQAPPNVELAVPARDYQKVAAHALTIRRGLLLADDLGLGKSVSAICAMITPGRLPTLVVCPTHLPTQWAGYLARFAPQLRVHIIRKGTPYPLTKHPGRRQSDLWPDQLPDVIIINYHKLRGWAETLSELCRFVVFDEAQQLRHDGSSIYQACKLMARKTGLAMGLTATPIYNYGIEFFNVVDCLMDGALGESGEFVREWCSGFSVTDPARFGAYLRREGIMLRRTRAEVGRELPELTKIPHTIEADTAVLDKLKGTAIDLAKVILSHNEQYRGEKMHAAGEFDVLMRQATGIAKAPYTAEFVRILVENGERVVLFGWHREVYNIWLERLAEFNPVLYTGTESPKEKNASLDAFKSGESRVLIMSLRSGSGADGLQEVCTTVVFGELDWSPGVHEQCIGRVHRDGQQQPCMAYYLIAEDGSDPVMSDVLGVKREQIEGVRNPDTSPLERINTGEPHIRRLAEAFLASRGVHVPKDSTVSKIQTEPA